MQSGNALLQDAAIVGFDIDGTLVKSWSPRVLAGMPELVAELRLTKQVFVATNQGGPFWRLLTGQHKYPSPRRLVETMAEIATATGLGDVPWYVAVHPGAKHESEKKRAIIEDAAVELHARLQGEAVFVRTPLVSTALDWRKPETGMLDAALRELGVGLLAYVGDLETDRELAANAGALFVDAAMWRGADEEGNPLSVPSADRSPRQRWPAGPDAVASAPGGQQLAPRGRCR